MEKIFENRSSEAEVTTPTSKPQSSSQAEGRQSVGETDKKEVTAEEVATWLANNLGKTVSIDEDRVIRSENPQDDVRRFKKMVEITEKDGERRIVIHGSPYFKRVITEFPAWFTDVTIDGDLMFGYDAKQIALPKNMPKEIQVLLIQANSPIEDLSELEGTHIHELKVDPIKYKKIETQIDEIRESCDRVSQVI